MADKVLFFDGYCNLCNQWVDFILTYERSPTILFASLQSETCKSFFAQHNFTYTEDSIVYFVDGKFYSKSKAVFKIAIELKTPFNWIRIFRVLPENITNIGYDFIAKNRYKWFGKTETCRIPNEEERNRFLV